MENIWGRQSGQWWRYWSLWQCWCLSEILMFVKKYVQEEWMEWIPTKTLHLSHVMFSYLRVCLQMYMTRFGQLDTVLEKLNGGWWGNEEKRKLKRFFFWVQSSAITNLWEKKSCRKERGESFRRALFKTCAPEIIQTCKYFVQTTIGLENAPYFELSSSNIAVCASFSKCPEYQYWLSGGRLSQRYWKSFNALNHFLFH